MLDRIRTAETVGLFTSEQEDPPQIARQLLARGLDYFRAYVCENLGGPTSASRRASWPRSRTWSSRRSTS